MTQNPDPSISILARLKNVGRKMGYPADLLLLYYVQEGLMARLSRSSFQKQFVLKGGLSLYARFQTTARPTIDIDLGAIALSSTLEAVKSCWLEILAVPWQDQLTFEVEEMQLERILEGAKYEGVRLMVTARLGRAKQTLQLDISFGNVITPEPVHLFFPTLLAQESHSILVYPLESVVAEKFAAMTELGLLNTRMKDFFDLYQIANQHSLELTQLSQALKRTFAARGTALEGANRVFQEDFMNDTRLTQRWSQFLRRSTLKAPASFREVMLEIQAFIVPVLEQQKK
jgi:predicted nucleotidyltransferase component of viral defense system